MQPVESETTEQTNEYDPVEALSALDDDESAEPQDEQEQSDEGDESQDEHQEETQEELEEIEFEGKRYNVPKDLKKGLMLNRDYTHKTQQLAEQRRAFEEHAQSVQAERQYYANQLSGLIQQLDTTIQPEINTDWELLAKTNPVEYVQRKAQFDKHLLQRQQAVEAQAAIQEQVQIEHQRQLSEHIQRNREMLPTLIKEWADPEVAKQERAAVRDYLLANGFDQSEVAQAYDARQITIARKAMLFDKMMSTRTTKPAQPVPPKVIKPGATPNTQPRNQIDKRLVQKFRQSGSARDAAALIAAMED